MFRRAGSHDDRKIKSRKEHHEANQQQSNKVQGNKAKEMEGYILKA